MVNFLENLIESFVRDGIITEGELEQRISEERAKSPLPVLEADVSTLSEKTNGMQVIDNFTLSKTNSIEEKTVGLQAVDAYALKRIGELESKLAELESNLGGNA